MSSPSVLSINFSQSLETAEFSGAAMSSDTEGGSTFADMMSQQITQYDDKPSAEKTSQSGNSFPAKDEEAAKADVSVTAKNAQSNKQSDDEKSLDDSESGSSVNLKDASLSNNENRESDTQQVDELLSWLPKSQQTSTQVSKSVVLGDAPPVAEVDESEIIIDVDEQESGDDNKFAWLNSSNNDANTVATHSSKTGSNGSDVAVNPAIATMRQNVLDLDSDQAPMLEVTKLMVSTEKAQAYQQLISQNSPSNSLGNVQINAVAINTEVIVADSKEFQTIAAAEIDLTAEKISNLLTTPQTKTAPGAEQLSVEQNKAAVETELVKNVVASEFAAKLSEDNEEKSTKPLQSVTANVPNQSNANVRQSASTTQLDNLIKAQSGYETQNELAAVQSAVKSNPEPTAVASTAAVIMPQQTKVQDSAQSIALTTDENNTFSVEMESSTTAEQGDQEFTQHQQQSQPRFAEKANLEQGNSLQSSFGIARTEKSEASATLNNLTMQQLAEVNKVTSAKAAEASIASEVISIHRKDFAAQVGDKVMMMINQRLRQFDIRLDPPELGSMQIKVSVQNEQAVVNFVVQNQQAKEAVEQNINRLREMMAEQGLDVADANVKEQSKGQSGGQDSEQDNPKQSSALLAEEDTMIIDSHLVESSPKGVDYYV